MTFRSRHPITAQTINFDFQLLSELARPWNFVWIRYCIFGPHYIPEFVLTIGLGIFMVLVNIVVIILISFLNHPFAISGEALGSHDVSNEKENFETLASNCTKAVVLASSRSNLPFQGQIAQSLRDSQASSFSRPSIPRQDQRNNGDQCTMAMRRLPPAAETHGRVLSSLPATLAECHGSHIRAQSRGTAPSLPHSGSKTPSGNKPLPGGTEPGPRAERTRHVGDIDPKVPKIAIKEKEKVNRHRHQTFITARDRARSRCRRCHHQQHHGLATAHKVCCANDECPATAAANAASATADSDNGAGVICTSCTSAAFFDASTAQYGISAKGVHRDGKSQANGIASGHETEGSTHVQVRRGASNQRSSFCSAKPWPCKERRGRSPTSTLQSDHFLETLPGRCSSTMARLYHALPAAGAGATGTHPTGSCSVHHSQGGKQNNHKRKQGRSVP